MAARPPGRHAKASARRFGPLLASQVGSHGGDVGHINQPVFRWRLCPCAITADTDTPHAMTSGGFSRPAGKGSRRNGRQPDRTCCTRRRCPRRTVLATAEQSMRRVYRRVSPRNGRENECTTMNVEKQGLKPVKFTSPVPLKQRGVRRTPRSATCVRPVHLLAPRPGVPPLRPSSS
jgi:hypothetical protein